MWWKNQMIRDRKPTTRPFESTPFRIYIYAGCRLYVCKITGMRNERLTLFRSFCHYNNVVCYSFPSIAYFLNGEQQQVNVIYLAGWLCLSLVSPHIATGPRNCTRTSKTKRVSFVSRFCVCVFFSSHLLFSFVSFV